MLEDLNQVFPCISLPKDLDVLSLGPTIDRGQRSRSGMKRRSRCLSVAT